MSDGWEPHCWFSHETAHLKQRTYLSLSALLGDMLILEQTRLNGPVPQGESDGELDGYLPKPEKKIITTRPCNIQRFLKF